jgi:protein TonB
MAAAAIPFRIGGPAAASLLVNALLLAGLLSLGIGQAARRTETSALTVMSLAALKGAEDGEDEPDAAAQASEPAKAAATPAANAPVQTPLPPTPPTFHPTPVAIPTLPSMQAAPAKPAEAPATQSAAASSQQAAQAAPAPAPPVRRGTADGLDAKAPAGKSNSYAAKVRSWLYAHKIYPKRARMRREEGQVRVRFVIDRAGMLIEGVIVDRSGNDSLDEEATAMMRRASPYPKAPPEIPGDRIEFVVPIEFTLPV